MRRKANVGDNQIFKITLSPEDAQKFLRMKDMVLVSGMTFNQWLMAAIDDFLSDTKPRAKIVIGSKLLEIVREKHHLVFSREMLRQYRKTVWTEGEHFFSRTTNKKAEIVYDVNKCLPHLLTRKNFGEKKYLEYMEREKEAKRLAEFEDNAEYGPRIRAYHG